MYSSWQEAGRCVVECIIEKCQKPDLPISIMSSLVVRSLRIDTRERLEGTSYISKERLSMILMWRTSQIPDDGLFAIRDTIKALYPMTWKFIEQTCL